MTKVLNYFLNRSFVVNLISAMLLGVGILTASMIKRDLLPPITWQAVGISASLPGASATDVEKHLLFPMETALKGLPSVEKVTSQANFGKMEMLIRYPAGYSELDVALDDINNRINAIRYKLPDEMKNLRVARKKIDSVFHQAVALVNFDQKNIEHRKIAKEIRESIQAIPGIVEAELEMEADNVYVMLNQEQLTKRELSVEEVRRSIHNSLSFAPVGQVEYNESTTAIEIESVGESIPNLRSLPIRSNKAGETVTIADIGEVQIKPDQIRSKNRFNGKQSLNMWIKKDVHADALDLKKIVNKKLAVWQKKLQKPLEIKTFIDGPYFIEQQLRVLRNNGIFGFFIVLLLLTLFFNFRVSLVTSMGIPIAYCGTLIVLYALGISIDLISVVGMILVLGILVDDAIIIAEKYFHERENGKDPKESARIAARDLILPVTGTIITTIVAFIPIMMIKSELAMVFFAVPVIIITSLFMSWFESFFILPNHLFHFISKKENNKKQNWFINLKKKYEKLLTGCLERRYHVMVGLLVFTMASAYIATNHLEHNFNFEIDIERVSVKTILKKSSSLAETEAALKPIEDYLLSLPKNQVQHVTTSIGSIWSYGRNYKGFRYAKVNVYVDKTLSNPGVVKKELINNINKYLKTIDTSEFTNIKVKSERRGAEESKENLIAIKVISDEDVELTDFRKKIESTFENKANNLSLVPNQNEYQDKWVFVPDSNALIRHQLSPQNLAHQLRSFFVPHAIKEVRLSGENKWLYTKVKRPEIIDKAAINSQFIMNGTGVTVPLQYLGNWIKKRQLSAIKHENNRRLYSIDVSFDENKTNIIDAKKKIQALIPNWQKDYPTATLAVVDANEKASNNKKWAIKVAFLCISLVIAIIALVVSSLTLPFLVALPIPFGLLGITWALYIHGLPLGVMALIGLIGTVGVSVNDSLIMIDQINNLKKGKCPTRKEIVAGASARLRAIILTTITTLGGVFPMAYGLGGKSGFTQPLAFSLGWGLTFSTLLTLFILPAILEIRSDIKNWLAVKLRWFSLGRRVRIIKQKKILTT